eukprot:16070763-Heterocapsa_arctica.AAC.1
MRHRRNTLRKKRGTQEKNIMEEGAPYNTSKTFISAPQDRSDGSAIASELRTQPNKCLAE